MKKFISLVSIYFGFSAAAQAGIMIEPYAGYNTSSIVYKGTASGATEYTDDLTGMGYGLRLGYKFLLPWAAIDYTGLSGTGKPGQSGSKDYDYSISSLGAVVGVDLPIMFRFWGGYGFSNTMTVKGSSSETKYKGTYTKLGLGWKAIPLLSINFEYIMNTWSKIDVGGSIGEVDADQVFGSIKHNSYLISVSVPFNL